MGKIKYTNPHYLLALSLIDQAKDIKFSKLGRKSLLDRADKSLKSALQEAKRNGIIEIARSPIEKAKKEINGLREEL